MALIVIYIVLRCARLLEMDKIISTKLLMLCLGLSAMFFIMSVYIAADITWDIRSTASCWSVVPRIGYNAPPTFILAGVLFLLFQRWHPPTIVTRIALFLGPSLLAVYLIHICSSAGQDLMVNRPFQWGVDNFPHLPHQVISIGTAGYCFIVCIAIDLIRRFALTFFRHCLHRIAIIRSRTSLP